jgi:hypothetical protein
MVMDGETEHSPGESTVDKTVEVARIVFHVSTPLTVVEANGRRIIRFPGATSESGDIDTGSIVDALAESLNGLVRDTAGAEFGVAQVQIQASGSIEIVAVIVATYVAVRQVVDVLDTLQKVAGLGRWLVQAVMRTQLMRINSPIEADSVHARVDINPAMTVTGRTGTTSGNASGAANRGFTLASSVSLRARGMLLLAILNLIVAGAVLAVLLIR